MTIILQIGTIAKLLIRYKIPANLRYFSIHTEECTTSFGILCLRVSFTLSCSDTAPLTKFLTLSARAIDIYNIIIIIVSEIVQCTNIKCLSIVFVLNRVKHDNYTNVQD